MFPSNGIGPGSWSGADWRQGGTSWAVDYPRADRRLAMILRRLTRLDVRSVEQPVNLDDGDDVYHWPFLMAGLPGSWDLSEEQAAKLRDYLLRGGFLLCDSFFGTREWSGFVTGMRRVFPERTIIDLPDDHPIFHNVYDSAPEHQIANWQALGRGEGYRADGAEPQWRGIEDDRVVSWSSSHSTTISAIHGNAPTSPTTRRRMSI